MIEGYVDNSSDCDDTRADRNPGTVEACDRADNDCDGETDEGVGSTFYPDADGDGQGSATGPTVIACTAPPGYASSNSDCDDTNREVGAGFSELCDRVDNDCDGEVDETGPQTFWQDADGDGFGDASRSIIVSSCTPPAFHVANPSDCDDANDAVHPGADEVCDALDNDCSSGRAGLGVDRSEDVDGDLHAPTSATCTGGPYPRDDCNDGNATIHPGAADLCDRLDNDCSSGTPTDASEDADADGHAAIGASCTGGPLPKDDCDDADASVHPGAAELCDGLDSDCSAGGGAEPGEDADGDLHAPIGAACAGGFPRDDCNDAAAASYGGAPELCDRIDNDCSSGGGAAASEDADSDGHAPTSAACSGGPLPKDDCNDASPTVYPGAAETCDRFDSDCSAGGGIDSTEDADGDSHAPIGASCAGGFPRDDCNDANGSVYPGAAELCDGIDSDRSAGGGSDPSEDADGDRHASTSAGCSGGSFPRDDCDDSVATTYGGAPELCNRVDDNCDSGGGTDASEDADSDGHAATGAACTGGPLARDDCNDANATIYPGASELCDRLDNDCSSGGGADASEDADSDSHAPIGAACTGGFSRDDCDDARAATNPGATEVCNRIDDDCSSGGGVDASEDADSDLHAAIGAACDGGLPRDDCADTDSSIYPGSFTAPPLLAPENGAQSGSALAASAGTLRPTFRWRAPAGGCGPPRYDIQVDDSCTTPGFAGCTFSSPEATATGLSAATYRPATDLAVSSSVPVGRRYYWRVRACEGAVCSAWSAVRYVDVGRVRCDLNGDGRSDVIVGHPWYTVSSVVYGRASFYLAGATGDYSTSTGTGNGTSGSERGLSVACGGDLDADGFGDAAVGEPGDDLVLVLRGSAAGPTALATPLSGPAGSRFGRSVAFAGDVNADGYADLVVGASLAVLSTGAAYVYHGEAAAGVGASAAATLPNPDTEVDGRYGFAVAGAGDVNGDGFADVIVGAYAQDRGATDEGNAFVHHGAAGGVSIAPSVRLDNPGNQANAEFGWAVAGAGDVDGDGFADVIVGAPDYDNPSPGEGNAFVFRGGPSSLETTPSTTLDDPGADDGANFGTSVAAAGDVDADGFADVIVGAPDEITGSGAGDPNGAAFVFRGAASGLSTSGTILPAPGSAFFGQRGGAVAGIGDANADGYADVIVGDVSASCTCSGTCTCTGRAFVHRGGASGISTTAANTLSGGTGGVGAAVAMLDPWGRPGPGPGSALRPLPDAALPARRRGSLG